MGNSLPTKNYCSEHHRLRPTVKLKSGFFYGAEIPLDLPVHPPGLGPQDKQVTPPQGCWLCHLLSHALWLAGCPPSPRSCALPILPSAGGSGLQDPRSSKGWGDRCSEAGPARGHMETRPSGRKCQDLDPVPQDSLASKVGALSLGPASLRPPERPWQSPAMLAGCSAAVSTWVAHSKAG